MDDQKRTTARKILIALYEAWENHTISSLDPIRSESGLDEGVFHAIVQRLEEQRGLIKEYGSGYTYEITPAGILHAEENGLIQSELLEKHRSIRRSVLSFLVERYEQQGTLSEADVDELATVAGKDSLEIYNDLSFLHGMGYIQDTSSNTYQITQDGMRYFRGDDYDDLL